jgi:hypothetical protein
MTELYRLVSRVLNGRLLAVFRSHAILHPAQRAGFSDGDYLQCLDVILHVIEDAKLDPEGSLHSYSMIRARPLI